MDIQQLKYFLCIAKYRNFTKAAEHFYIGQPALSRQIFDLEKQLGVKLFTRSNRSVELTSAGEILQKEGTLLIERINNLTEKTRRAGEGKIGSLRMASLGQFNKAVTQLIQDFRLSYPDIKFRIERYDVESLNESILYDAFDIGISFAFAVSKYHELDWITLYKEKFCVLMPQDHPLTKKSKLYADDLVNSTIILPEYICPTFFKRLFLILQYNNNMEDSRLGPLITYASSMESLLLQVTSGFGISLIPYFIVSDLGNNYLCTKFIEDIDSSEEVVLVWRKDNENASVNKFIEHTRDVFRLAKAKE